MKLTSQTPSSTSLLPSFWPAGTVEITRRKSENQNGARPSQHHTTPFGNRIRTAAHDQDTATMPNEPMKNRGSIYGQALRRSLEDSQNRRQPRRGSPSWHP